MVLGLCTLVRLDMIVPFLALLGFLLWTDPQHRARHLVVGLSLLLIFVGSQTLFRIWYFGDPLPNSYYLKMTGYPVLLRITRGLSAAFQTVLFMNVFLFILAFGVLIFRRDPPVRFLVGLVLIQFGYSIFVGGDAWEWWGGTNRFISIAIPLFFILLSYSLPRSLSWLQGQLGPQSLFLNKHSHYALGVLLALSLLNVNSIYGPTALSEWLLIKRTLHIEDNENRVRLALALNSVTAPEAKIAVTWAGVLPYFSDRYCIDLLGRNDRGIARLNMRRASGLSQWAYFYPGHLKWDYGYSIGQLNPDLIVQVWQSTDEALPYLQAAYLMGKVEGFPVFLRKGSTYLHWDDIQVIKE